MRNGAFLLILIGTIPGLLFAEPPLGTFSGGDARSKLLTAAETYLGTPYRYGGVDRRGDRIFRYFPPIVCNPPPGPLLCI
jgi:hypothetical protein